MILNICKAENIFMNRILMIVCTLIVFVIVSLLKFVSNIHDEHFVNQTQQINKHTLLLCN